MNNYIRLNLAAPGGGTDDKTVKISSDDILSGFLEDKIVSGSAAILLATLLPGGIEQLEIDLDETQINHDNLMNYVLDQHRLLDDASTTATSLWSSTKIQGELDNKINKATPVIDNTILKTVGTTGVDVEATGVIIDDSDNMTGINDLTIDGDLTVNGTTTTVNSDTLDVVDPNITVNNGGTQASADTSDAGITVTMTDATDVTIGYDSTTTSKMKVGEVGSESEIVTTAHAQTVINKSIDADTNTITNLETDNLKAGVLSTDLDLAVDNTNIAGAQAIKDYVVARVAEKDDASEITYTPAVLADWDGSLDPGNTDGGLDQLAERTTDTETALSAHLDVNPSKHTASQINNVPAGNLAATEVQAALDELQTDVDTRALDSDLTAHINDVADAHAASAITNTPAGNIAAVTIQAAIDELDTEKYVAADFDTDFDTRLATKDSDDITEGVTNLYFTEARAGISAGDLAEGSFNLAESASGSTVTGFLFLNAVVRSFEANVSVEIDATADLFEEFTVRGIQKGASWDITVTSLGDDTLINFDIDASGQVIYDSSTYAGFLSGAIKYRAITTSV